MGEGKCFLYFLTSFGRIKSDEQQRFRFNFGRKEEKEEPPKLYHFRFLSFNFDGWKFDIHSSFGWELEHRRRGESNLERDKGLQSLVLSLSSKFSYHHVPD